MNIDANSLILAFLRLNDKQPIQTLSKIQLLVFIFQNGGLSSDTLENSYQLYSFEWTENKPYSASVTTRVKKLQEEGYIQQTNNGSYKITQSGCVKLNNTIPEDIQIVRDIKLTKNLYNTMPITQVLDLINSEF